MQAARGAAPEHEAVAEVAAAPESTVERPLESLGDEICELAAHIAAATCRWLLLLAEFDRREGWAEWGLRSCAHWLSWRCSLSLTTAREHVRVARRLDELPLVRETFAAGILSFCKVRALTRVATPETEAQLLMLAEHSTGAQLDTIVRGFGNALAADNEAACRSHEYRSLSWEWEDDGSLRIRGRLPAEEGALVVAALEAARRPWPGDDEPPDGAATATDPPSAAALAADALGAVARIALAAGDGPPTAADPCQLVVHVDARTLAGGHDHGNGTVDRCELEHGPALAPETARRLGCDAALVRIIERDGEPLSVGRRKRTIPAALRRALRSRDAGCRFPGCTHGRFLHAHHIEHWAHGGTTELGNLVQLCSHHHRLVHEGGFTVERRQGAMCFRRPDGRPIAPVAPGGRARGPGIGRRHQDARRQIDPNTCGARSAGAPLDYGLAVGGLMERALAAG